MSEAKEIEINQHEYGAPCSEGDYPLDYTDAVNQSQDLATVTIENQGAAETADAVA